MKRMNRFQKAEWLYENDGVFYFGKVGRGFVFIVKGKKEKFYSVRLERFGNELRGNCKCDYLGEDCSHILSCKIYMERHKTGDSIDKS
jgi:hypothetical protein